MSISPLNSLEQYDTTKLNNLLESKNFSSVLNDPNHFWTLFCQIHTQLNLSNQQFSTSLKEKTLTLHAENNTLNQLKNRVEEIRKCLINHHSPALETTPNLQQHLNQPLQSLMGTVGVATPQNHSPRNLTPYFTYPISPQEIAPRAELNTQAYQLYQNQTGCDLMVHVKERGIGIHSLFIHLYGGQTLASKIQRPSAHLFQKAIHLNQFKQSTITALIDFLYLGEEAMQPSTVFQNKIDLRELFVLAREYAIPNLIDCCTNLMTLCYTVKEKELVDKLANTYQNEHLKRFAAYLEQPPKTK